jgi:hypothetical protein
MGLFDRLYKGDPKGPSNNDLILAMKNIAEEDSPQSRRRLYQELHKSILLLPKPRTTDLSDGGRWIILDEAEDVEIVTGQNSKGEKILFAFTDLTALSIWEKQGINYIALRSNDIFRLAQENQISSIIINPAGPFGGEITSREIGILVEGAIPQFPDNQEELTKVIFDKGTSVLIGAPSEPPSKIFTERLRDAMSTHPAITAGYVYQTKVGNGDPHLVVGIQFSGILSNADYELIFESVARGIQPAMGPNDFVDFMVLKDPSIISAVKDHVKPVYISQPSN